MSELPDLGPSRRDRFVAALRAIAGAAPVAGPGLVELINEIIPNQRMDRLETFVRMVAIRLEHVQAAQFKVTAPENIDLLEDAAYQAVRAISAERREQLANLLTQGIADERRGYLESKRVLRILEQLDDAEVVRLASYLAKNHNADYRKRHADILYGPRPHLKASRDEIDQSTVVEAAHLHLVQLGLLNQGQLGGNKAATLSNLGRLVLRRIGLAEDDDF